MVKRRRAKKKARGAKLRVARKAKGGTWPKKKKGGTSGTGPRLCGDNNEA